MTSRDKEGSFLVRLEQVVQAYGLDLTANQKVYLLTYLEQLSKWNKTYNLTAIRDQDQALIHHLFDSLSVVKPLMIDLHKRGISKPELMDVGSGGGLPGVILAIAIPEASITCVDAVEKKIAFIRHVTGVLQLRNMKAMHARVEEMPEAEMDIVTSRAFTSLKNFADLSGKHVAENGALVAMKGKQPVDEMSELNITEWNIERIEKLTVPELDAERCLVWMQRKGKE